VNGRSPFFGSGKVNALKAVQRAKALFGGSTRHGAAQPNLAIPDNNPEGVVSHIDIPTSGPVEALTVGVDITHTYRGDLVVTLISPEGFPAELHRKFQGGGDDDLKRVYRAADTASLAHLVNAGIEGGGRWTLHVSDNLNRDVGTLNAWRLDLRPSV
jgi:serine protease